MPGPLAAIDRFPRVRLGHSPTPLEPAPNLGAALGIELWLKRDDCTGLAFGGNKVRQLEFYLGEARARGADTLLTTGAVQSNFVRVAAAGARQLGMDVHLQLENRVEAADDLYRGSGNVLLDRLLGATLHAFAAEGGESAADAALDRLAESLSGTGRKPYVIHVGLDQPPLGGLGYVVAASEVLQQVRARGIGFDAVVCASGGALTHAGLLVGLRGARRAGAGAWHLRAARCAAAARPGGAARATELAAMIGFPKVFAADDVHASDEVHPPGYGLLNEAIGEAISMAARLEALLLDPVYTGKAMAGLVALVRAGRIAAGSRVLFVHTGGLPAIFSYASRLEPWLAKAPPETA